MGLLLWIGLSALFPLFLSFPGALPQAGMNRACGPPGTRQPIVETTAPKIRHTTEYKNGADANDAISLAR